MDEQTEKPEVDFEQGKANQAFVDDLMKRCNIRNCEAWNGLHIMHMTTVELDLEEMAAGENTTMRRTVSYMTRYLEDALISVINAQIAYAVLCALNPDKHYPTLEV